MSVQSKNCPTNQKKLTRAKPPTAPPQPVPVFTPIPCSRDQRAYRLHLETHTQRWIADKLKCAQPTVLRGIRRMEKWLATTLPEDRGEYTATEKLRLALAKHERLMEVLLKKSLREFRRSRQTIPMKKTITTQDGVNEKGEPVKIRVEEWKKPQIGRKGFIDAAGKASHEITVLASGWLGPGNGSISCAEVMDPEERDRWDRLVTTRDARIEELLQRVADLESRHRAGRQEPAGPGSAPAEASRQPADSPALLSRVAENNPVLYQEPVNEVAVTSTQQMACVPVSDTQAPREEDPQNLYQDPSSSPSKPGKPAVPRKRGGAAGGARLARHVARSVHRPTPPDVPDERTP
jgi:hypothetical protein